MNRQMASNDPGRKPTLIEGCNEILNRLSNANSTASTIDSVLFTQYPEAALSGLAKGQTGEPSVEEMMQMMHNLACELEDKLNRIRNGLVQY